MFKIVRIDMTDGVSIEQSESMLNALHADGFKIVASGSYPIRETPPPQVRKYILFSWVIMFKNLRTIDIVGDHR